MPETYLESWKSGKNKPRDFKTRMDSVRFLISSFPDKTA